MRLAGEGCAAVLAAEAALDTEEGRLRLAVDGAAVSEQPVAVVRPGDGSESGWREPSMYFSAEKKTAQGWKNVERRPIGRCGLYNSNWQDDVVVLKPGEEIDVGVWMPTPYSYFNLSEGTYRFRLHYNYTRGEAEKKSPGSAGEIPPSLVDTPAFSLVSEPLIYKINPVHTQQSKCSPTKPTARRPSRPGDGPAGS